MYRRAKPTVAQQQPQPQPQPENGSPLQNRGPAAAATATATATGPVSVPALSPAPADGTASAPNPGSLARLGTGHGATGTVRSSLIQPRVAVVLGVHKAWLPALFAVRLLSITPAVLFGLPTALRLLAMLHLMFLGRGLDSGALGKLGRGSGAAAAAAAADVADADSTTTSPPTLGYDAAFEARLRFTETLLASIWCFASGYLSFFFTDCLMSRWLLHYKPFATLVRMATTAAINGYLTSWVLHLTGGFEDPRLVLPAWIIISTTLTVLYHITQRKINIRKETSLSISVFSIASFVSMVALLAQLHSNRSDYPDILLLSLIRRVGREAGKLAILIMEYGGAARDL